MADTQNMTGIKKAAMLLITLGEELSSKILGELDDDEVQDISREIALTKMVDPDTMEAVVEEFYNMLLAKKFISKGGLDYAKSVLTKSLGPERARKIIDRLTKLLEQSSGFEFLTKIEPKQLAKFIQNEHPQTIALILAHLDPTQAAESLAELPEDLKAEVAIRIANLQDISPSVVKTLSKVLEERFESISSYNVEVGGVKSVAEIFNRMDRTTSKQTLERLEKDAPELVASIRDMMFVFEDIKRLGQQAIQEILKRADKNTLTLALKGADEELKNRFFESMSKRAVETMKEEMDYMGPVKLKDVEKAQHEIVEIVRELDEEGVVSISGGDEEQYV
ncbi:flagellar motor switch protein FliG [Deferribacterales bacterium Es71-Z0220]|jgi:flagellar motor switch protein FliG|uniref:flagellar motor switch protein FliG n=1 Tax=Deferrivibrio essentukiensis TaxID=2880922 RepID=UPI001F609F44|nr:flagellar motor switch protein FliG [Deferrivibrio essentukiensis]MBZ4672362.1 fliG [Deferribacteraceae bacterium]MCB4203748.1 flagellar motor switch protein FliG [Deferrivibrio essentukiensis]